MIAAQNGQDTAVKTLLEHGTTVNKAKPVGCEL